MTGCFPPDEPISPIIKQIQSLEDKIKKSEEWVDLYRKCRVKYDKEFNDRLSDIEYRLKHIIALPTEIDIRLQDVERQLENAQCYISEIKHNINDLYNIRKNMDFKKPHKCPVCLPFPVCDGSTVVRHQLNDLLVPEECRSCKGEGIVWG